MMTQSRRRNSRLSRSAAASHAVGARINRWLCTVLACVLCLPALAQPEVPQPGDTLDPLVQRMLDDDLLTAAQRRDAMIFHGQWALLDALTESERLRIAVATCDGSYLRGAGDIAEVLAPHIDGGLDAGDHAALNEALLKIATLYQRTGEPEKATTAADELGHHVSGLPWRVLLARAYVDLGRTEEAIAQLMPLRGLVLADPDALTSAADLSAAAEAVLMLARLEGRPSADFHLANELLSRAHEEADPLYWPAYVTEARLLFEHGNPSQAIEAVSEALALNPNASDAWYLLGTMMTRYFNFDAANRAAEKLYDINPAHPLGDALTVQIALRQKDVAAAQDAVSAGLERYPEMRLLLALDAATQAMSYEPAATAAALEAFETLSPGNPLALFHVGRTLADARQYELAETCLEAAIDLQPGWSTPQLELGQLYMQWGDLGRAAAQLQQAAALDPFHKDITNSLRLAQEMLGYETIETDHFIIRYRSGIDEVLARDMARRLEPMADLFTERFGHTPVAKTQVDLMPDDEHFAVRVTGMPDIWTIAACTGDVIAMTPPRPGPKRAFGTFNWLNVMRHEYTHTVNLGQTHNRVPHWFTEGCAVNMETTGRRWSQYQLLAECYNNDKLFAFDELNWGFIRPTEDYHRPLAYAQSAWIMQYIETAYGWDKAHELLAHFEQGTGEHDAMEQTFGLPVDEFMDAFLEWAGNDVASWGMTGYGKEAELPDIDELLTWLEMRDAGDVELDDAMREHLADPSGLRRLAEHALLGDDIAQAVEALNAYRDARPADPWSHRQLTRIAIEQGQAADAMESMTYLDKIEGDAPEYAVELARVHRRAGRLVEALHFAERAVLREPYNPTYRELVAAVAVQSGDWELGAFHIEALALMEPDRSIHPRRLVVVYTRLERDSDAAEARARAEQLEALE
ncbi:tetratricopeptide repeat protein [Phycisphaeraceae bacterium D3-23]